jgi:hypothetical protein
MNSWPEDCHSCNHEIQGCLSQAQFTVSEPRGAPVTLLPECWAMWQILARLDVIRSTFTRKKAQKSWKGRSGQKPPVPPLRKATSLCRKLTALLRRIKVHTSYFVQTTSGKVSSSRLPANVQLPAASTHTCTFHFWPPPESPPSYWAPGWWTFAHKAFRGRVSYSPVSHELNVIPHLPSWGLY